MLTSVVLSSTLANVALGAAVPDKFVRRQEDGDSSSSSMMDSSIASSSMMPSSASSIMDSMSGSSTASSAAPTASSSQSYAEGLVSALDSVGLSTLASLVEPLGDDFIGMLDSDQNMTIFTPTNEALSNVNINTSDTEAVREVLSYHILPEYYPVEDIPGNQTHVIASTLQGDALAFYKDQFGTTRLIGQDTYVITNRTYENLLLKWVDSVLMVPGPIPQVLNNTASSLVGLAGQFLPDIVQALNKTDSMYTVFAPNNEAITAAQSALAQVAQKDQEALEKAVQGHVLDKVVYSTNITDGLSATTLNGDDLSVSVNDTGVFVMSNGAEAQVVGTDYVASNGVVHLIDSVLFSMPDTDGGSSASSGSGSMSMMESSSSVSAEPSSST